MTDDLRAKINRELTATESDLLAWVVEHSADDPHPFLTQIPNLRVVGRCSCGCPTIELALSRRPHPREIVAQLVAEADGNSPEGIPVGVLVFAKDGVLSELEVYSRSGEGPFSLPSPDALSPAPPEQHA